MLARCCDYLLREKNRRYFQASRWVRLQIFHWHAREAISIQLSKLVQFIQAHLLLPIFKRTLLQHERHLSRFNLLCQLLVQARFLERCLLLRVLYDASGVPESNSFRRRSLT